MLVQRRGERIQHLSRRLADLPPRRSHCHNGLLPIKSRLEERSVAEFRKNLLPVSDVSHLNRDRLRRL
jgi:hypothetical protein